MDQKTSFLGYAVQRMPVGLAKDLVSSSNGSGNSGNGLTALVGLGGPVNTGTVNTGSSNSAGQNSKSNEMGSTQLDTSLNNLFDSLKMRNGPLVH